MACNSNISTKTNASDWKKNLPSTSKKKRDTNIPIVEGVWKLSRIETNRQILGHFAYSSNREKLRRDRINIMIKDLELLWKETLDFPALQSFPIKKIDRLLFLQEKKIGRAH